MKKVFICTPYKTNDPTNRLKYDTAARILCKDAIKQGYAPFAPHLLYPQFMHDADDTERQHAIQCGLAFLWHCDELWYSFPYGTPTEGMQEEIDQAKALGLPTIQKRWIWG